MRGLAISPSAANLIACDDSSGIAWRQARHDLAASAGLVQMIGDDKKIMRALGKLVWEQENGRITPS